MNHMLFPMGSPAAEPESVSNISLGGCFYDYLRSFDGKLVGVRYWIIETVNFELHPVYSQFSNDARFAFNQLGDYVDIVFEEHNTTLLQNEQLVLDVVQEFGGEGVVKCGNKFGIFFSIHEEAF